MRARNSQKQQTELAIARLPERTSEVGGGHPNAATQDMGLGFQPFLLLLLRAEPKDQTGSLVLEETVKERNAELPKYRLWVQGTFTTEEGRAGARRQGHWEATIMAGSCKELYKHVQAVASRTKLCGRAAGCDML